MRKLYNPFTIVLAKDYKWDIGDMTDFESRFQYTEAHAPTLNCSVEPMPDVFRSSKRRNPDIEDTLFLSYFPLLAAG